MTKPAKPVFLPICGCGRIAINRRRDCRLCCQARKAGQDNYMARLRAKLAAIKGAVKAA